MGSEMCIRDRAMQAARKIVDDTKGNQDIYDQFLKGAGDAHVNEEVK